MFFTQITASDFRKIQVFMNKFSIFQLLKISVFFDTIILVLSRTCLRVHLVINDFVEKIVANFCRVLNYNSHHLAGI